MEIKLSDHFTYKKLLRFVFPTVIMMIFTSIYGVVDGLFVSNFVGKTAFAAINFVMPFEMVLGGMGFLVGTGGTALVSKVMGEGDEKKANRCFSMMISFSVLLSVVATVIGFVFLKPIAVAMNATDEMLPYCLKYGYILTGFTGTFVLQSVFQSFYIAAEKPKLGLWTTVIAGVSNMIMDALFVGLFRWGVVGAAVATGISQLVGAVIPLVYFMLPNSSRLRLSPAKMELKPILKAVSNGASELMSSISSSIVGTIYNIQLIRLLGENGVSAYGVLMYSQFIFIAVSIGYSIGSAPVISFNYGAKNTDELKNLLKKSLVCVFGMGVGLTIIAVLSAPLIARLFVGYDSVLCELTTKAFYIYSIHFLLAGFNIFFSGFFTALNNGLVSALISFLRTLVFQVGAVLILPLIFGAVGIWWAVIVAEVAAVTVGIIFLVAKRKKYQYY